MSIFPHVSMSQQAAKKLLQGIDHSKALGKPSGLLCNHPAPAAPSTAAPAVVPHEKGRGKGRGRGRGDGPRAAPKKKILNYCWILDTPQTNLASFSHVGFQSGGMLLPMTLAYTVWKGTVWKYTGYDGV